MVTCDVAVITGSGFYDFPDLKNLREVEILYRISSSKTSIESPVSKENSLGNWVVITASTLPSSMNSTLG